MELQEIYDVIFRIEIEAFRVMTTDSAYADRLLSLRNDLVRRCREKWGGSCLNNLKPNII